MQQIIVADNQVHHQTRRHHHPPNPLRRQRQHRQRSLFLLGKISLALQQYHPSRMRRPPQSLERDPSRAFWEVKASPAPGFTVRERSRGQEAM
jgi:hypothetical protein